MSVTSGSRSSPAPWPQKTRSWSVGRSLRCRWARVPSGASQTSVFQSVPGRAGVALVDPDGDPGPRPAGGGSESLGEGSGHVHRVGPHAAVELGRAAGELRARVGPARAGVERHEHLGQGDQPGPSGPGLADEVACLVDARGGVQDHGRRLHHGHAHRRPHGRRSRISSSTSSVCSPRRGAGRPLRGRCAREAQRRARDELGAEGGVVDLHQQAQLARLRVVEQGQRPLAHHAVGQAGLAQDAKPVGASGGSPGGRRSPGPAPRSSAPAPAARRSEGPRGGARGPGRAAAARASAGRSRPGRCRRRRSRRGGRARRRSG